MTLPSTISSRELCELSGYSAPALVDLEKSGVIARSAKDTWPIETVTKIVSHLRERKRGRSEAENRLIEARAKQLELRTLREAGDLVPTAAVENYTRMAFGRIVAECAALPPRYTRDLREQNRLEGLLNDMRTRVSDFLDKEGDALWIEAQKAARRRS